MKTAKSKKKIKIVVACVLAAVAVCAAAFAWLNAYKVPFYKMEKTYEKGNVDYMMEAIAPMSDVFGRAIGKDANEQFRTSFENKIDEISAHCGDNIRVHTDYLKVDKLAEAQRKVFIDKIEEYCEIDLSSQRIGRIYVVDVRMTAEGDKGSKELENGAFYVAEYNGKWGVIWIDNLGE